MMRRTDAPARPLIDVPEPVALGIDVPYWRAAQLTVLRQARESLAVGRPASITARQASAS